MRSIALGLLLVFSQPVVANETVMTLQTGKVTVRLMQSQCSAEKVLPKIQPAFQDQFRTAAVLWRGSWLTACWIALPESRDVLIVDETGDNGTLPMSAFKPEDRL